MTIVPVRSKSISPLVRKNQINLLRMKIAAITKLGRILFISSTSTKFPFDNPQKFVRHQAFSIDNEVQLSAFSNQLGNGLFS